MMIATRPHLIALAFVPASVTWRIVLVVIGSLLIGLAAQISIPLPFSPVPVTGQTLAVMLVAASLGARLGAASVALYVAEGLLGLPVFAGGASGAARLLGPTGGYLVGFVAAAAVVGWLAELGWAARVWKCALALILGEVVLYVFGLAWLARFPLQVSLVEAGLLPFLVGDAYKVAVVALAVPTAARFTRPRVRPDR